MKLKINVKKFSKKQNEVALMELEYPEGMKTAKDLLTETVKIMVAEYEQRIDRGEALTVLTEQEIADKSGSGKIGFEINYGDKRPDLEKSIQAALECFEDGIVALFVDGKQYEGTEETISLTEGSEITFVRMTLLAGRMW